MSINDFLSSRFGVAIFSLAAGALLAKLSARTKQLRYWVRSERLALSADDPIFGPVRVTWREMSVRNLHMVTVEVQNASGQDFENVDLKVYTGNDTLLLTERTEVVNSPYIVTWADEYAAALTVAQGGQPTPAQWTRYNSSRDYTVPVFNRGQLLRFHYFCSRPNDDEMAAVFVSTRLKGARLKHQTAAGIVHGVPVQFALTRGLIAGIVVIGACGYALHNVWAAGTICLLVGLFVQTVGALAYRGERWLKDWISGRA